jgi:hypothetical protein
VKGIKGLFYERCKINVKLIDGYNAQLAILATASEHLEAAGIRR